MRPPDVDLHLVETLDDLWDMKAWLGERRDWLGCDIETEGLNVGRDRTRLFQVGDTRHGWAVPWEDWGGACKEFMRAYDRRIVAHNLMFETKFLVRDGVDVRLDLWHDTMIMAHLNNSMLTVALKPLSKRMLGAWAVAGQQRLDEAMSKQGWTWSTVPIGLPAYWQYGALDPVITVMLADKLWPLVQDQRFIYDVELAAISVMARAELRGITVDLEYTERKTAEMYANMDAARPEIPDEITNPGSDKQVISYLQRMGAQLWKTTDKGNLSCDDDVMREQEERGIPGAAAIRKWRRSRWRENSHVSNLRELNGGGNNRPSIPPGAAKTSRMSITDPALQTVPRGSEVRDCYVSRPGHSIISADYDQLELRVLADGANEEAMLQAIREGRDLHNFVAESLYSASFTAEQRQICKNGQFAIVYGAGIAQFARTAGISVEKAEEFFAMYGEMFPGVARFMRDMITLAKQQGYIETKWGRRVPVPSDKAYVAVNYYCQPTATSDLIKLKIHELSCVGLGDYFMLPIHDEVLLDVPDDILPEVMPLVDATMTEETLFACPMTASGIHVMRWGDKKRLEAWEKEHKMRITPEARAEVLVGGVG